MLEVKRFFCWFFTSVQCSRLKVEVWKIDLIHKEYKI